MQAKSIAQHKLHGTYRKDRHGSDTANITGYAAKPDGLTEEAAAMWDEIVPTLSVLGCATTVDAPMLHGLIRWYSLWREADAAIESGEGTRYSRLLQATTCWKQFAGIASQFGLTPADRMKLRDLPRPEIPEDDPLVALLNERLKDGVRARSREREEEIEFFGN